MHLGAANWRGARQVGRIARVGISVSLVVGSFAGLAGRGLPAGAEDPIFVDWTSLLPSLTDQYDPNSANECVSGKPTCVDKTIREMTRRFDPLAAACDHNAVFSLSYLRTTEEYRRTVTDDPAFFADTPFVNHEDAVFAKYYFQAYDAWAGGNRAAVPGAWLVALDAAKARAVSGSGNLFLGMNAHVNRDLPFVLAAIGLVAPDGTSRKADHDKVNVFLNRVVTPLLAEEAARFDPAMDDAGQVPLALGYTSTFQLLASWREGAWRNAERLANAADSAARAQVAAEIEAGATAMAQTLVAATAYGPLSSSAARDAYCAVNHG